MTAPDFQVLSGETAVEGLAVEVVVAEGLTRTQVVQYAGASGDYNPLHTDEVYAVETTGHPATVVHGMLTMGVTGRAITEWIGEGRLVSYGVRFLSPVHPGTTLTTRLAVASTEPVGPELEVTMSVETVTDNGTAVVRGTAVAIVS